MYKKKWFIILTALLLGTTLIATIAFNRFGKRIYGQLTKRVNPQQFQPVQDNLVITNVHILSPDGTRFLSNRSVFIQDGHIAAIDSGLIDLRGYTVLDGKEHFLIPGLIDAHIHLFKSPNDLLLYIANGITQVRELIGEPAHLRWKREIEQGRIGPDLFVASPRLGSFPTWEGLAMEQTQGFINVPNAESAQRIIKKLHRQGYDGIKLYSQLNRESYLAATATARELDMPSFGHIPWAVSLDDVWSSGQSSIAHVEEVMNALRREFGDIAGREEAFLAYVDQRSRAVAQKMNQHQIAITTTLWLTESFVQQKFDLEQILGQVALAYENPGISEWSTFIPGGLGWLPSVNRYRLPGGLSSKQMDGRRRFWETYAKACRLLTRNLHEYGVSMMAGTDANLPLAVPGFSLHDELQSLHNAGLTHAEVLRTATATPAEWLGKSTGKITVGYQADLVLLRKNPLRDIKHTRTVEAVITNGKYFDRPLLDQLLTSVKKANDQSRNVDIESYHSH